jgi:hypothetical protein
VREVTMQVGQEEHEDLKLPEVGDGDRFRNLRKRRLTMAPKVEEKKGQLVTDSIIERGIRDGSINWMVVTATSSWGFGVYSDVLINYFRENTVLEGGGTMEKKTNIVDGLDCGRGTTHGTVHTGPKCDVQKAKKWFWIRKGQAFHPNLGFIMSAADVR